MIEIVHTHVNRDTLKGGADKGLWRRRLRDRHEAFYLEKNTFLKEHFLADGSV